MNITQLDMHYYELCSFGNVECTPAWYCKLFSRVFYVKCYGILLGWQGRFKARNSGSKTKNRMVRGEMKREE